MKIQPTEIKPDAIIGGVLEEIISDASGCEVEINKHFHLFIESYGERKDGTYVFEIKDEFLRDYISIIMKIPSYITPRVFLVWEPGTDYDADTIGMIVSAMKEVQ